MYLPNGVSDALNRFGGSDRHMTYQEKPLLLTVREVARILRIHRPKVYQLIREGKIDGFKLGCDWRIRRVSIEELVGPIPESFFDHTADELDDDEALELRKSPSPSGVEVA
jgi:excisionase family DNA binding protein